MNGLAFEGPDVYVWFLGSLGLYSIQQLSTYVVGGIFLVSCDKIKVAIP